MNKITKSAISAVCLLAVLVSTYLLAYAEDSVNVYYSGAVIFLGADNRLQAYEIDGRLAIHVDSLAPHGFDITWDSRDRTFRISDRRLYSGFFRGLPSFAGGYFMFWADTEWNNTFRSRGLIPETFKTGGIAGVLVNSDIRFVLNGMDIPAYSTGGDSFILVDDLINNLYVIGCDFCRGHDDARICIQPRYMSQWRPHPIQSDIGKVNILGIHPGHRHINQRAHELVAFAPAFDGVPIATAHPYALVLPGETALVPLAATVEVLGLSWEWNHENSEFTIFDGDINFEAAEAVERDVIERPDLFEAWLAINNSAAASVFLHNGVVYVCISRIALALGLNLNPGGNGFLTETDFGNYPGVEVVATPRFDSVMGFSDDLIRVAAGGGRSTPRRALPSWHGGLWGLMDGMGNEVWPPVFERISVDIDGSVGYPYMWGRFEDIRAWRNPGFRPSVTFTEVGLTGIMDIYGNIIAPAKYHVAWPFCEAGFARVQSRLATAGGYHVEGFWGFIDKNGNEVVPLIYTSSRNFSEGLAAVSTGGLGAGGLSITPVLWGFVDTNGNEIVPFIYEEVRCFRNGFAAVRRDGLRGFVDRYGNEIVLSGYSMVEDFQYGGFARVNIFGWFDQWGGLVEDGHSGLWGAIDTTGREVVPPVYSFISTFTDGVARVNYGGSLVRHWHDGENVSGGLWGLVDSSGNEILPPTYNQMLTFENGLARVEKGGLWGLVDKAGNEIVPPKYGTIIKAGDFTMVNIGGEGTDWWTVTSGLWGLIDNQGNEIAPPIYSRIWVSYGLGAPCGFHGVAMINIGGEYSDETFPVFTGGLWGLIDYRGNILVPPKFDHLWVTSNGLFMAGIGGEGRREWGLEGGLWGLIDRHGNEILPPIFDSIGQWNTGDFRDGYAIVRRDGLAGIADKNEMIVQPVYAAIEPVGHGLARVTMADSWFGPWGLIDTHGNELTEQIFDEIGFFTGNTAVVRVGNLKGVIDTSGRIVIPPRYDDVRIFPNGLIGLQQNGLWGLVRIIEDLFYVLTPIGSPDVHSEDKHYKISVDVSEGDFIFVKEYNFTEDYGDGLLPEAAARRLMEVLPELQAYHDEATLPYGVKLELGKPLTIRLIGFHPNIREGAYIFAITPTRTEGVVLNNHILNIHYAVSFGGEVFQSTGRGLFMEIVRDGRHLFGRPGHTP